MHNKSNQIKSNQIILILAIMRNVSDKGCREKQKTHFKFNNFFQKSCRLWDNIEKYVAAWQTTDGDTAHVRYVLET